jgi:hypothetical protein
LGAGFLARLEESMQCKHTVSSASLVPAFRPAERTYNGGPIGAVACVTITEDILDR